MNEILVMIGLLILLILSILLSIVIKMAKNTNKNVESSSQKGSNEKESQETTIDTLELPSRILKIDGPGLRSACKTVFDSYKACGYKDKASEASSKKEWHSWQVSMLLAYLQGEKKLPPIDPKEVFTQDVLDMDKNALKETLNIICVKYKSNVNLKLDRDSLSKDNIWSAREVAVILYSIIAQ